MYAATHARRRRVLVLTVTLLVLCLGKAIHQLSSSGADRARPSPGEATPGQASRKQGVAEAGAT